MIILSIMCPLFAGINVPQQVKGRKMRRMSVWPFVFCILQPFMLGTTINTSSAASHRQQTLKVPPLLSSLIRYEQLRDDRDPKLLGDDSESIINFPSRQEGGKPARLIDKESPCEEARAGVA